jgi:hypothetical protein
LVLQNLPFTLSKLYIAYDDLTNNLDVLPNTLKTLILHTNTSLDCKTDLSCLPNKLEKLELHSVNSPLVNLPSTLKYLKIYIGYNEDDDLNEFDIDKIDFDLINLPKNLHTLELFNVDLPLDNLPTNLSILHIYTTNYEIDLSNLPKNMTEFTIGVVLDDEKGNFPDKTIIQQMYPNTIINTYYIKGDINYGFLIKLGEYD